jgi:hypothetical protein
MPASAARQTANAANAQLSTGPKSPEGKASSSQNARKHGLTAETVVLPNESEEEYQAELQEYFDHFAPANKPEADLVLQLASAHWRIARYTRIETDLLGLEMERQREHLVKDWKRIEECGRVALAFEALSGAHSPLALLNRYQTRLHHEYQRILKALLQLQAARLAAESKLPNERAPQRRRPPVGGSPTPRRCRYTWIASEPDRWVTAGMGAS